MNPYVINQGPALVLHFDEAANTVRTQDPKDNQMTWTKEQLKQHCQNTILKVFNYLSSTSNYPERFIYALAGLMFRQTSPYPIGGKKAPGFRNFCGKTANDLLEWIATQIIIPPIMGRGHRLVEPGTCLRFCASKINEVIRWEIDRRKDDLDNAVLHGLSKTGHLERMEGVCLLLPLQYRDGAKLAPPFGSDEDGIQRRLLEAHAVDDLKRDGHYTPGHLKQQYKEQLRFDEAVVISRRDSPSSSSSAFCDQSIHEEDEYNSSSMPFVQMKCGREKVVEDGCSKTKLNKHSRHFPDTSLSVNTSPQDMNFHPAPHTRPRTDERHSLGSMGSASAILMAPQSPPREYLPRIPRCWGPMTPPLYYMSKPYYNSRSLFGYYDASICRPSSLRDRYAAWRWAPY